jgi:integrase
MGLGGYPEVTLAAARQKAREAREKARSGVDPVHERKAARSALKASQASAVTFRKCAESYISVHGSGWKNAKHAQQWRNTLEQYAFPKIGDLLVRDIEKAHVLDVLQPIWTDKTETASRLRGRIELVLSYAMQAGYRPEGLNPARWRGGLDKLLLAKEKAAKREHFPALPADQMGEFMERLRAAEGVGARALEFVILTAARSGEVRGATWSEIDLESAVWIVPAERMKASKEHRVPLSAAALSLLRATPRSADSEFIFAAPRGGRLSDMTLTAVMRRMDLDAVPHGFRSTFRDWCAEQTNYPREVAEMALAHTVADKVEAAYRRGDLFEKRRRLMEEWATFCAKPKPSGEVVPLNKQNRKTVSHSRSLRP